jgi:hypothetical protein
VKANRKELKTNNLPSEVLGPTLQISAEPVGIKTTGQRKQMRMLNG